MYEAVGTVGGADNAIPFPGIRGEDPFAEPPLGDINSCSYHIILALNTFSGQRNLLTIAKWHRGKTQPAELNCTISRLDKFYILDIKYWLKHNFFALGKNTVKQRANIEQAIMRLILVVF